MIGAAAGAPAAASVAVVYIVACVALARINLRRNHNLSCVTLRSLKRRQARSSHTAGHFQKDMLGLGRRGAR